MKKTLTIIGLAMATLAGAQAQTLLSWNVQGVGGNVTTLTANSTAGNLTVSGTTYNTLSRTGLTASAAGNSFNSNSWNITNTFDESNDYISFTVLASASGPGYNANFTDLQYVVNGSNTAPGTGRWGYRIGSGAFTLQDTFSITFATPGSLATWDFADFSSSQAVEFRFWGYGATSINGGVAATTGTIRISNIANNDLVLNGSVTAIPEPSVVALAVLSGMVVLFFRRRRVNA
jgi:hypothetical protein